MSEFDLFIEESITQALLFIQGHFWQLFMIIVMLIRVELRWIGLIIGFVYIIFGECPNWLWVIMAIIAVLTEIDKGILDQFHDMTNK